MKLRISLIFCSEVLMSLLLTACSTETPAPTPDLDNLATRAVQTFAVQLSQTAQALPTVTPSPKPATTLTIDPGVTSTLTATQPAAGIETADKAVLVLQSPMDGAELGIKQKFDIIFTVKNDGQTTWTRRYKMRYFSGWEIAETQEIFFPKEVKPGEEVRLIMDVMAPPYTGSYITNWKLSNADGQNFYDLYLKVIVVAGNTSTPTETATATPE